jgi:hypothetical protein
MWATLWANGSVEKSSSEIKGFCGTVVELREVSTLPKSVFHQQLSGKASSKKQFVWQIVLHREKVRGQIFLSGSGYSSPLLRHHARVPLERFWGPGPGTRFDGVLRVRDADRLADLTEMPPFAVEVIQITAGELQSTYARSWP